MVRLIPLAIVLSACRADLTYRWDDSRVLCSIGVDDLSHTEPWQDIEAKLNEAAERRVVAIFHAHIPGETVSRAAIDRIFSLADERHLDYVTFSDLADPHQTPRPALAFAFDDNAIDAWFATRDLLDAHHARVTFFVSRWAQQSAAALDELVELAAEGHELQAHSVNHLNAGDYVREHGLDAYMTDEVLPSIEIMRANGFEPTTFAYPFGVHDDAIDQAVLEHVVQVRTTPGGCPKI